MPGHTKPTWVVTGGAGYIGAHVVHQLLASGSQVAVIDDLSTGVAERVPSTVTVVRASLLEPAAMKELFARIRPTGVIHLAAKKSPTESVADPLRYARENVGGLIELLNAMLAADVHNLVFSSSCSVYGAVGSAPVHEEAPMRPISPYGETKAYGEQLLESLARTGGLRVIALRYFNVAGAGSALLRDRSEVNLLPNVLRASAQGDAVQVFGLDYDTPDGTCIRDYVDVRDLADAHVVAAGAVESSRGFRAYNVGTGQGVSVLQMIRAVERVTGMSIVRRAQARRPGDPPVVVAATDRIAAELGWAARRSLEDTIGSSWDGLQAEVSG